MTAENAVDVTEILKENAMLRQRLEEAGINSKLGSAETGDASSSKKKRKTQETKRGKKDTSSSSAVEIQEHELKVGSSTETIEDPKPKRARKEKPRKKESDCGIEDDSSSTASSSGTQRDPATRKFSSMYVGVQCEMKGPPGKKTRHYVASISDPTSRKVIHLGSFKLEIEAARAFDAAARPLGRPVNFAGEGERQAVKGSQIDGSWQASISVGGIKKKLGYFLTEVEAAKAYDASARALGRPVNFPEPGEAQVLKEPSSKYVGVIWHKPSQRWTVMISIQNQNKSLGYFRNEEEVRVMNFYLQELALNQGALCLCQAARKYDEIAGALGRFVNFPNPLIPQNLLAPPRQPFSSKFLGVRRWVTQSKYDGNGKPRRKQRSKQEIEAANALATAAFGHKPGTPDLAASQAELDAKEPNPPMTHAV